jgi:hypothetical protein
MLRPDPLDDVFLLSGSTLSKFTVSIEIDYAKYYLETHTRRSHQRPAGT